MKLNQTLIIKTEMAPANEEGAVSFGRVLYFVDLGLKGVAWEATTAEVVLYFPGKVQIALGPWSLDACAVRKAVP
jgi:hypothetical protein